MEKFTAVKGIAASFRQENIDTDAIIPATYLRSLNADLGGGLFGRSRYGADGKESPDFVLNRPPFRDSRILVAGANFGCGSSREGAVWALLRFGIRCVIAPSFGDIFFENAFKNGLLPVILPEHEVRALLDYLAATNDPTLSVDLKRCVVETPQGRSIPFAIPPARRTALLEGLDEIGQTLQHGAEIAAFQTADGVKRPWVHARARGLVSAQSRTH